MPARSRSWSLFLYPFLSGSAWSADHSIAPYRNYDYRHCHVTARTARSRINETASKSRPPPPAPALHIARSATPVRHPPLYGQPASPPSPRAPTFERPRRFLSLSLSSLRFSAARSTPTRFATLLLPNNFLPPSPLYPSPSSRAGVRWSWKKSTRWQSIKITLQMSRCKWYREALKMTWKKKKFFKWQWFLFIHCLSMWKIENKLKGEV